MQLRCSSQDGAKIRICAEMIQSCTDQIRLLQVAGQQCVKDSIGRTYLCKHLLSLYSFISSTTTGFLQCCIYVTQVIVVVDNSVCPCDSLRGLNRRRTEANQHKLFIHDNGRVAKWSSHWRTKLKAISIHMYFLCAVCQFADTSVPPTPV